jgi:hypothetical protein
MTGMGHFQEGHGFCVSACDFSLRVHALLPKDILSASANTSRMFLYASQNIVQ